MLFFILFFLLKSNQEEKQKTLGMVVGLPSKLIGSGQATSDRYLGVAPKGWFSSFWSFSFFFFFFGLEGYFNIFLII
jgi:hypothetical protein